MNKFYTFLFTLIALFGLVTVRVFENTLFYDPLIEYFKSSFQTAPFPELDKIKYFFFIVFRFGLNLLFSTIIIGLIYKSKEYIKATLWVHLIAFILLIIIFYTTISFDDEWAKMATFYIRRFLIHPILLFILLPGFFFISKTKS